MLLFANLFHRIAGLNDLNNNVNFSRVVNYLSPLNGNLIIYVFDILLAHSL